MLLYQTVLADFQWVYVPQSVVVVGFGSKPVFKGYGVAHIGSYYVFWA